MNKVGIAILLLIAAGCNNMESKQPSPGNFVGVFVRSERDSTGALEDTFYITRLGNSGNLYSIKKASGIININDNGKPLPKEYKVVFWNAEYRPDSKSLYINDIQQQYVEDKEGITNGHFIYQRIKG